MLPQSDLDYTKTISNKTKTHKLITKNNTIRSYIDDKEALEQAIYKILNTQRNKYLIYSRNYGIEIEDLFGEPTNYVISQLEDRIKDALITDDRILDVHSFSFEANKGTVSAYFNVSSIYGELNSSFTTKI